MIKCDVAFTTKQYETLHPVIAKKNSLKNRTKETEYDRNILTLVTSSFVPIGC